MVNAPSGRHAFLQIVEHDPHGGGLAEAAVVPAELEKLQECVHVVEPLDRRADLRIEGQKSEAFDDVADGAVPHVAVIHGVKPVPQLGGRVGSAGPRVEGRQLVVDEIREDRIVGLGKFLELSNVSSDGRRSLAAPPKAAR